MSAFSKLFKTKEDGITQNIKEFYQTDDENINFKTDLDMSEIELLSKLELQYKLINAEFGVKTIYEDAGRLYKEQKVSYKRKGRKEWVEVSRQDTKKDEENKVKKMLGL